LWRRGWSSGSRCGRNFGPLGLFDALNIGALTSGRECASACVALFL
jgi:hypothetical protein